MITIQATENEDNVRIDRILRKRLALMPLSSIYSLIRRGGVRVDGRKVRQDYRLKAGEIVIIDANESEAAAANPDAGSLARLVATDFFKRNFSILHEDADLMACNKPAGLVVHPGTGHVQRDSLIDLAAAYLLSQKKIRDPEQISLVHRLDRDTSGVILIAKNKVTVRRLHELFRGRALEKMYVAVCHGRPPKDEGEVALPLVRGRDDSGETTMKVGAAGAVSRTRYRIDAFHHNLSRLEVFLETGRTHQIRAHLAAVGAPIVGDQRYGDPARDQAVFSRQGNTRRLYLHAHRLTLPAVPGRRQSSFTAPLPKEFKAIMAEQGKFR
jgi:RluA family pseudouridine synthase